MRKSTLINAVLACSLLVLSAMAADKADKDADKGTVVFYRTRNIKGSAVRLNITDKSGGTVGFLTNGSKMEKKLAPGSYTFVATSPSIAGQDSVTLEMESGKTYYIKGEAKPGWPAARPKFTLMDEKKGKAESDKIE